MNIFCVSNIENSKATRFIEHWKLNYPLVKFVHINLQEFIDSYKLSSGFEVLTKDIDTSAENYKNLKDNLAEQKLLWLDDQVGSGYLWFESGYNYILCNNANVNSGKHDIKNSVYELYKQILSNKTVVYKNSENVLNLMQNSIPFSPRDNIYAQKLQDLGVCVQVYPKNKITGEIFETENEFINYCQAKSSVYNACTLAGSASSKGLGFLSLCMGSTLVDEKQFCIENSEFEKNIQNCDLILILDSHLDLMNVTSSFLEKVSQYNTYKPVVVVSESIQLSKIEMNDYGVSGNYLCDFTEKSSANVAKNLSNTWKI